MLQADEDGKYDYDEFVKIAYGEIAPSDGKAVTPTARRCPLHCLYTNRTAAARDTAFHRSFTALPAHFQCPLSSFNPPPP